MSSSLFVIENGWLMTSNQDAHPDISLVQVPSPFFNQRPSDQSVNLLVVHNISVPAGNFDPTGVDKMFTGSIDEQKEPELAPFKAFEVSAHCLITRDGNVRQYVSFDDRAWHAGVSEYAGIKGCNDYSVGIELSGADTLPYTEAQYRILAAVTQALLSYFPAMQNELTQFSQCDWFEVTGHEHIAPDRKTDPGPAFDWQHYLAKMEQAFS